MRDGSVDAFVFQGANLVLPGDVEDPRAFQFIPGEQVFECFGRAEQWPAAGYCEIPRLDGRGSISAFMLDKDARLPETWRSVSIRQALAAGGRGAVSESSPEGLLFRAFHIMQWRRDSVYCGSCGGLNADAPAGLSRICPACGRAEFPRISPAVIVLITNHRDEILLARNANFINNVYSLIAGFVEAGESLEAAAKREILEEVNIEVQDLRYAASQPWPFPNSLMLGFTATYAGGDLRPDGTEILDARWFSRETLPNLPGNGSIARRLIERWKKSGAAKN
ncbi:MAG: NAD(+) diphosphatase [Treponema sp.]|jgi:NAD+ diphosphatase|nr:NAD(+) diphosphatase [Treponema sp.]